MLEPFKITGEFWETDENGERSSEVQYGILEWDPSQKVKNLTLFSGDKDAPREMCDEEGGLSPLKPVCIHGFSIQNMKTGARESRRYSIDAFRNGGSFTAGISAGYSRATRSYLTNNIWSGDTFVNLHSARYTQIGFSFKGLDRWARHIPSVRLRGLDKKTRRVDTSEMDILRDMSIPNVGKVRLLCGHQMRGETFFEETLRIGHQWQIDFSRPKTFKQCLDILHAFWDSINIAVGAVVPLGYVILTKGDRDIPLPERFFVRISHTTADSEGAQTEKVLRERREYMPLPFITKAFWEKWMKAALSDEQFRDYVTLLTAGHRIERMPQQYEVLTLIVAIEAMVKQMSGATSDWFPKKQFREIVDRHTPQIFPEGLLDTEVQGEQGLLDWTIETRNNQIAHIGEIGAVHSYDFSAGIYTGWVLRLLAVSLLMLKYKLLPPYKIRRYFWECYRSKEELKNTPDTFVYTTIFANRE